MSPENGIRCLDGMYLKLERVTARRPKRGAENPVVQVTQWTRKSFRPRNGTRWVRLACRRDAAHTSASSHGNNQSANAALMSLQ